MLAKKVASIEVNQKQSQLTFVVAIIILESIMNFLNILFLN